MTAAEEKAVLRASMRRLGRSRSAAERRRLGDGMLEQLRRLPAYQQAQCVLAFYGVGHEIDTTGILTDILREGKRLCLPLCLPEGELALCVVEDLSELVTGAYGIPAPSEAALRLPPQEPDLLLVPCVCATRTGLRLGQGGGYYDRLLPHTAAPAFLLCPEDMLVDALPCEAHDLPLPTLISERACYGQPSGRR